MPELRRPLGLVLSGGGALGSWQAAALRGLENGGLAFDSVIGFSMGAITGAYYCLDLVERGMEGWRSHRGGTLRLSPRLFPPSIFSNAPIAEAAACAADEEEAKRRARCRLTVISAYCTRSRAIYATYTPGGRQGWDGPLSRHLLASCAIPLIFPPVTLDFRGERHAFFDGGVPCAEPMSFAALAGCRDVVVLDVVRPEEVGRKPASVWRLFDQRARESMRYLIGQGLASLRSQEVPPRVFRLGPSRVLGYTMLDFNDLSRIAASLRQGEEDARRFLEQPERYLEAA